MNFSQEDRRACADVLGATTRRLRAVGDPAKLLPELAKFAARIDRSFEAAPAHLRAKVACRAGCGACCRVPMGVQAHEVLIAAQDILLRFNSVALDQVIARTSAHRRRLAEARMGEASSPWPECALLSEGSCTIYSARPEVCRAHHSANVQACLAAPNDIGTLGGFAGIEPLRSRLFAVMLGIDQGVAQAGFDGVPYDFGSALNEALTNPLCVTRWKQRQRVFPDDCREYTAPGATPSPDMVRCGN